MIALISIALAVGFVAVPWVWMWALAFAVYAGCKWMMWRRSAEVARRAPAWRSLAFLLAWPGMNAREFLDERSGPGPGPGIGFKAKSCITHGAVMPARAPCAAEWLSAAIKTLLGAGLIWIACPWVANLCTSNSIDGSIVCGWVGMVGVIFLAHLGIFHLLSLAWRAQGVTAPQLFDHPAAATSLSDFWGRRWNRGFREIAYGVIFRPLVPRLGAAWAMFGCFFASGLVHDLVISLPAGGGFGLPTAYFTVQGIGVLVERSSIGARLGLRNGFRGWLFMALLTAGPAFWLFHPPFVRNVMTPFLEAIGAI